MNEHPEKTYLVGYDISLSQTTHTDIDGSCQLNGERYIHILSMDEGLGNHVDMGRRDDGELIWVSNVHTKTPGPTDRQFSSVFDPPAQYHLKNTDFEQTANEDPGEKDRQWHQGLWNRIIPHKSKVMISLVVVTAGIGLFLMLPTANSTQSVETLSTPVSIDVTPTAQTAEEAAIEFVYSGAAAIPMTLDDVAVGDLTAVVMSRSGDLVLVEVTQKNSAEMTKIATLLLQKTEATWRIREVFDSQEY